jgi:hypothetical protein
MQLLSKRTAKIAGFAVGGTVAMTALIVGGFTLLAAILFGGSGAKATLTKIAAYTAIYTTLAAAVAATVFLVYLAITKTRNYEKYEVLRKKVGIDKFNRFVDNLKTKAIELLENLIPGNRQRKLLEKIDAESITTEKVADKKTENPGNGAGGELIDEGSWNACWAHAQRILSPKVYTILVNWYNKGKIDRSGTVKQQLDRIYGAAYYAKEQEVQYQERIRQQTAIKTESNTAVASDDAGAVSHTAPKTEETFESATSAIVEQVSKVVDKIEGNPELAIAAEETSDVIAAETSAEEPLGQDLSNDVPEIEASTTIERELAEVKIPEEIVDDEEERRILQETEESIGILPTEDFVKSTTIPVDSLEKATASLKYMSKEYFPALGTAAEEFKQIRLQLYRAGLGRKEVKKQLNELDPSRRIGNNRSNARVHEAVIAN